MERNLNVLVNPAVNTTTYIAFIEKGLGKVNVIKHSKGEPVNQDIDIVLFTGGEDVDPRLYNYTRNQKTKSNIDRDSFEKDMFNRYNGIVNSKKKEILFLGICRGSQFLTVVNRGSLIQHVNNHTSSHPITISSKYNDNNVNIRLHLDEWFRAATARGERVSNHQVREEERRLQQLHKGDLEVIATSTHHQMLMPFHLNKDEYEMIAHSTYFRSDTYELDCEANQLNVSKIKNFVEPEIVYYPKTNSLAIQGHPEMDSATEEFTSMCIRIINKKLVK